VLSRAEGVSVQQVGGLGSQARFNLGGFDDTQVRFFIDGIPVEYQGFALGIQNVPLNLVERVDVYKGVVPIEFGADSLGGAFNLVTDRATAGLGATASYQGGSFDTHRATASARYLDPNTGLFFKGEGFFDSSDNDYPIDVEMGDRTGQTQQRRVRRFHDAYAAQGGNLELGVVNTNWARRFLLRAFASSYDKELQHNASMTVPYGEAAFGGFSSGVSLRHEHDMGLGLGSSLVLGYSYERSDFVDDPGDCIYNWLGECRPQRRDTSGELRASATDQSLWDYTGYARWNLRWEVALGHQLALSTAPTFFTRTGKDHLLEEADAFMPLSGKRDMFKWISGVEYRATDWTEQLENVLFVKSYLNTAQSEELLSKTVSVDRSVQGVYWGAGDGFRYAFTDWALAKLSYEYSVRLPEPREVFGNGAQIGENLDLEPERSHNLNVTFLVDDLQTSLGKVDASLTGFYRDARDLVLLLGRSEIFFYDNVFRARVQGIEAAATWLAPTEIFELGANVTYQDLRNHAEQGPFATFEGDRIPNKPYLFANGHARVQMTGLAAPSDELSFTWYTRYVHRFFRTWESMGPEEERPVIDTQLVHTAVVTYGLNEANGQDVSFSLEGQNLADSKVFDFYGVQRPGRSFFFKTVWTY
jgi:vitamin B12 transporter